MIHYYLFKLIEITYEFIEKAFAMNILTKTR